MDDFTDGFFASSQSTDFFLCAWSQSQLFIRAMDGASGLGQNHREKPMGQS